MNVVPWSGFSGAILSIEVAQLAQPCPTKYSLRRSSQQIDGWYTQSSIVQGSIQAIENGQVIVSVNGRGAWAISTTN